MTEELGPVMKDDWGKWIEGAHYSSIKRIGPDFMQARRDKELWDIGLSTSSLTSRVIEGLVLGSRAAKVGLRDGDILLRNDFVAKFIYWNIVPV
jgi:hypothetical protein